jgi:segregation and condensation protein B
MTSQNSLPDDMRAGEPEIPAQTPIEVPPPPTGPELPQPPSQPEYPEPPTEPADVPEPPEEVPPETPEGPEIPEVEPPQVAQPVAGAQLQRIIEGALLSAGRPLGVSELGELFEDFERPANDDIRAALAAVGEACRGRGFELKEVASGFRFQVVQEVAPWIARLWEEKPQRYSRALLETLALIAYRQPITRGDIEDIRGVAVASNIVKTLLERDWVRVVGHKDVPGRPAMYATTRKFLDYFNLKNLDDLPALAEIRDLDTLNAELALEGADTPPVDSLDGTELAADAALAAAEAEDAAAPAADDEQEQTALAVDEEQGR